jgi:oligoribonuclease NrnB/cAMP/cGMP phosphodiesterase (DHH superfamily)
MRIVTRPDFDGAVCAVLISDALEIRQPIYWVEPDDFKKGSADIRSGDIIANLPYDRRCDIWLDHHSTNRIDKPFKGLFRDAPSAARNVFDYFQERFKRNYHNLVWWADRIDSADFTQDEVLHPEKYDYVLLSMTISREAGKEEEYWNKLVRLLREQEITQVMADADVKGHCRRVIKENSTYADWLRRYTRVNGPVAITDFRSLDHPPSGNRFLSYCLFPETVVSVRVRYEDPEKQTIVVNIGHSIFNPHCNVHVGRLLSEFNGGGHRGAASARFPSGKADSYLPRIILALVKNQPEGTRDPRA